MSFELAIVGGGITGVTMALALAARGIRCTIYEQAPAFGEIGAGVGIHPGAVRAMALCDPRMADAFARVATTNAWPTKARVWFDCFDGTDPAKGDALPPLFSVVARDPSVTAHRAAHRARLMDELVALLPAGAARFGKRLVGVDDSGKRVRLRFEDGSSAEADAVLGCDGIKSRTREALLGEGHPAAKCTYTHRYVYRGLVPMAEAAEALGAEKAENATIWFGPDRHVLLFPVNHGQTTNVVAFVTDPNEWPSDSNLIVPATHDEVIRDFDGFGPTIMKLLRIMKGTSDRWGLFDLGDHPLASFYRGRVCLVGDAAHASTPHHGAGAGFCIEDVAVLAELLADPAVASPENLPVVFAAFDAARRPRDHWLVQSSRRAADVYEWREPSLGRDPAKIHRDMEERQHHIWSVDIEAEIRDARRDLKRRLLDASPRI